MAALILRKAALAFSGLVLFLVLLEVGIRLGGFVLLSVQEYGNLRSIKQKGAYRILCLGESATQGQYPHLLEQVLNRRNIGVRFSVIDKGRTGTNTPAILNRVESYLAVYHPDMVVAMMGINDQRVRYYQDIPESDTWLFRHCRVYRFGRILFTHILKKIKGEGICGSSGGHPQVEKFSERTVKLGPKNDIAYGELGKLYLDQGKLPQAEDSFRKAIELNPKNDKAYTGLGKLYLDQGKLSQAEDSFKKAIELNPKNDKAYTGLGYLYQDQGEFFQAENFFTKAIELDPKNDHAYVGLGVLYLDQGKFSQAEDLFKKALGINPKSDKIYVGLGRVYQDQNKFIQAEHSFTKANELNPKNDRAYVGLGWLYLDRRTFPQAEGFFRKAVELNPRNDPAYAGLGWLYRVQGKFLQAEDLFKKAVEVNPRSERVYGAMSSLYEEMDKPQLAKEYAGKADQLRLEDFDTVTVNNYRKLKKILDKRGIKLVCMQYPMRSVEPLKRIFEQDNGVIFVDNERIFKETLKKASYQEYFKDMFGGDFGHCTQKGNMLLAQNIANVILREVFNRQ